MAIINKSGNERQQIDLDGPCGNAFALMGTGRRFWRQIHGSMAGWGKIQLEMMSGDYDNLVLVFDREFGQYVDLIRTKRE